jgi:hypothetical protein
VFLTHLQGNEDVTIALPLQEGEKWDRLCIFDPVMLHQIQAFIVSITTRTARLTM